MYGLGTLWVAGAARPGGERLVSAGGGVFVRVARKHLVVVPGIGGQWVLEQSGDVAWDARPGSATRLGLAAYRLSPAGSPRCGQGSGQRQRWAWAPGPTGADP